jgi:hypothetical protein
MRVLGRGFVVSANVTTRGQPEPDPAPKPEKEKTMAKSEGAAVREAYDGPSVEHDALIQQILDRAKEQTARSSDASESAALVKEFLEDTGVNSKAYQWASVIVKTMDKKDGQHKAMDIIRSMEVLLPMIKNHVGGQGTAEMDLGDDADPDEQIDAETEAMDDDDGSTVVPFGEEVAG